jgi:heavy metal translocating P-type ATPase
VSADQRKLPLRAAALPLTTLLFIVTGLALRAGPLASQAHKVWLAGLCLTGLPVVWRTFRGIVAGRFAADVVAMLAVITAVVLDQPLPGLVVVLMQTGGEALERYAAGRASEAVRELEAAAPRVAHRILPERLEDTSAEAVGVGDRLLVRPGEMVPCDGIVESGSSHVDASRLTGEPIPIRAEAGVRLMSGSLNQESPIVLEVTSTARESQYARIVQLVREASATKSPLLRMADRYAIWFTPLTLVVCASAWLISHDSVRVLAVLVVATPCPLILAAPVAMVGGINQAARHNVVVRHGEALERLGSVTTAVFDKTGTLTVGHPSVSAVKRFGAFDEKAILRLAASVELGSGHPLARPVVTAAEEAGLPLGQAHQVLEQAGQGVSGIVDGHRVAVGALSYLIRQQPGLAVNLPEADGVGLRAWVVIDGVLAGAIDYADRLRPDLHIMLDRLAALGINRTMLLTGDHVAHADRVARQLGIAEIRADLLPGDKLAVVERLERQGERVVMLGDGTNDAPALRRATVGVALAAHGGGISAEAADAVILADDPTRLADAIQISRRTLGIARQSVWAGLGLTSIAMVAAAFGHIPPTLGALLQEVIDVAVILNALRASGPGRTTSVASGIAAENLFGGEVPQSELQPDPGIQISDVSFTGHSGR